MKTVSIQDLKRQLSYFVREAEQGRPILVVRHGRPTASITGAGFEHVSVGARFGKGAIRPLLQNATSGRYLAALATDRQGDPDGR